MNEKRVIFSSKNWMIHKIPLSQFGCTTNFVRDNAFHNLVLCVFGRDENHSTQMSALFRYVVIFFFRVCGTEGNLLPGSIRYNPIGQREVIDFLESIILSRFFF